MNLSNECNAIACLISGGISILKHLFVNKCINATLTSSKQKRRPKSKDTVCKSCFINETD